MKWDNAEKELILDDIERWLQLDEKRQKHRCPFGFVDRCNKVCFCLFPKTKKEECCPCLVYGLERVRGRAKRVANSLRQQLIKEGLNI